MSDRQLDRLEEKVDKINENLSDANITLARLTDTVVLHERRSNAAELRIEMLQEKVDQTESYVRAVNLIYKVAVTFCGGAIGLLSILTSLKKLGVY